MCIFSPAKTIADCWKLRNKIRLDMVLEALDRLTTGPAGGYTYGYSTSCMPHQQPGAVYGSHLTVRSHLGPHGRLAVWQNGPSSPTTASFLNEGSDQHAVREAPT
jgi:hypothetical protein